MFEQMMVPILLAQPHVDTKKKTVVLKQNHSAVWSLQQIGIAKIGQNWKLTFIILLLF